MTASCLILDEKAPPARNAAGHTPRPYNAEKVRFTEFCRPGSCAIYWPRPDL